MAREDRSALLRALLLMPAVSLALRLTSLPRVAAYFQRRHRVVADPAAGGERAERLARIVAIAVRNGVGDRTCLRASVTLWHLLGREGIASDLRIGVQKGSAKALEAHAWVELDGRPLNDSADVGDRFRSLPGLSRALERC